MSKRLPVVETLCNDCGYSVVAHTRADAFTVMELHEELWGHADQMWSSDRGRTRFRAMNYEGCWVHD